MSTTIYSARRIHTLDPRCPEASHVAVRDGRIVGVGTLTTLPAGLGPTVIDTRFADKVLLPGFVEGHAHADAGIVWRYAYCGQYERRDPAGRLWPPVHNISAILERVRHSLASSRINGTIFAWGIDPIHLDRPPSRRDLDEVSSSEPVALINASGHILYLNTEALRRVNLLEPGFIHGGLPRASDGLAVGELRGSELIGPAAQLLGISEALQGSDCDALLDFARLCVQTGVTTVTDLANPLTEPTLAAIQEITRTPQWPVRLVPALYGQGKPVAQLFARLLDLRAHSHELLRLGQFKLVMDGSIQGFTARLRASGYVNGAPNGLWYVAPEWVREVMVAALQSGVPLHIHTNGDEASDLALNLLEQALSLAPISGHRVTLQHAQLMDEGLMRRARDLGAGVNLFSNHIYYWGDAHAAQTVGAARAAQMNAAATAQRLGLPFSIHSDVPVTPMAPLFTAWCAVNRITSKGMVLGPPECLTVPQALHAITLGGAHTLGLEREIGSISIGKSADFAVLHDDPLGVAPEQLKDVGVWGTVCHGRVSAA